MNRFNNFRYQICIFVILISVCFCGYKGVEKKDGEASLNETISDNIIVIDEGIDNLASDEIDWDQYFEYGENNTEIIAYTGPFYSVVIPAKATSIAENAFDKKKRIIHSITFEDGSNCTKIGNGVFRDCELLSSITLPDKIDYIGDEAFKNTALRKISIPDSVTYLGSYSFAENKGIIEVTLGKGIGEIGQGAFENCEKLKTLVYKCLDLKTPCKEVFKGCTLKEITIETSVITIPAGLFEAATFAANSKLVLPETITNIGNRAFANTINLSLNIEGNSLLEIGESAFEGSDISNIRFPDSLTSIGKSAFKNCINVIEYSTSKSTVSIGEEAFKGCANLRKVCIYGDVIRIGKGCFEECSKDLKIYTFKDAYAEKWAKKNKILVEYAYEIRYKLYGGVNNLNNPIMYVTGEVISFNEPTRNGYEFKGWFKDNTYKDEIVSTENCEGKIKVYASWEPIQYSVKYILNGDSVNNKSNEKRTVRTVKKPFRLRKPKRKGYSFEGWYTNAEFTGDPINKIPTSYANDIVVYAKWKEYTYNILFDSNGGAISQYAGDNKLLDPIVNIPYTAKATLPGYEVMDNRQWQGYIFTGWNTLAIGNIKNEKGIHFDLAQNVSMLNPKNNSKVTLYAEWTPIEYNVNYVLNGGINNAKNPLKHTVEDSIKLKKPEKPGCEFKGWYLDEGCTIRVKRISSGQPKDITLYALWK